MATRWKTALAATGGAAVAAVAVIALSGRASDDAAATVPPDETTAPTPGADGDRRTITVNGHGTVTVVPDTAELMAGVQAQDETATAALDTVSASSQELISALEGAGVATDDIQTSGLSLWPTYGSDGQRITGYQASTNVTATIRDVAAVGGVVDALKGIVGDELTLSGISFSYDDPEAVLGEARAGAIANARVRAQQYAEAAGVEVGDIVTIIEGTTSDPVVFRAAAEQAADSSMAVAPGSQELTADATVTFAMG